jgi:hypothetical protein
MLGCYFGSGSPPSSRNRAKSAGLLSLRWGLVVGFAMRVTSCNLSCFPCVGSPDFWADGREMGFWLLPDMSGVCLCEVGEWAFATSGYIGVVSGLPCVFWTAVAILGCCDQVDYLPLA